MSDARIKITPRGPTAADFGEVIKLLSYGRSESDGSRMCVIFQTEREEIKICADPAWVKETAHKLLKSAQAALRG
jgi:hypothetical protein